MVLPSFLPLIATPEFCRKFASFFLFTKWYERTTGQAGKSLFIALLRKVIVLIPLAIILPKFLGVMGVFYSEPIADLTSASTSGVFLYLSVKKLREEKY